MKLLPELMGLMALVAVQAWASPPAPTVPKTKPEDELWNELSHLDADHRKLTPVLKKWIGKPVQVVGWVIPNEFEGGELTEFLLTHYPGGCVHIPLPPPSNLIHVHMNDGSKKLQPLAATKKVKVTGKLMLGERIDAGFELTADQAELIEN